MAKFLDTHCNIPNILRKLSLSPSVEGYNTFKKNYTTNRFEGCISVASDTESRPFTLDLIEKVPEIYGVCGIHPLYGAEYTEECEQDILKAMKHPKMIAYGEIGLDYHKFEGYNYAAPDLQKEIFVKQMKHAVKLNKPIVIHTREAEEDTFNFMKQYLPSDYKIDVHCFTDSLHFAQKLLSEWSNLYIGIAGVVTFKNSTELQNVVKNIPLDRILLETDGPFMAPVPHRGKPCHCGHLTHIAEKIAELKQVEVERVYEITRKNTFNLFGI